MLFPNRIFFLSIGLIFKKKRFTCTLNPSKLEVWLGGSQISKTVLNLVDILDIESSMGHGYAQFAFERKLSH